MKKPSAILLAALLVASLIALLAVPFRTPSAGTAQAQIMITYPKANQTVPGEIVELTGTGADPRGQLKVEVLTNKWWLQDGVSRVNPDGSWSYGPCYLSGQGRFNNHTIRVTTIRNGQTTGSNSVAGIRRAD